MTNTKTFTPTSPLEEHLRALGVSRNQKTSLILARELVWAGSTYARKRGMTLSVFVQRILEQHLDILDPDLLALKRKELDEQQEAASKEFRESNLADRKTLQHLAEFFRKADATDGTDQQTDITTNT